MAHKFCSLCAYPTIEALVCSAILALGLIISLVLITQRVVILRIYYTLCSYVININSEDSLFIARYVCIFLYPEITIWSKFELVVIETR